MPLIIRSNVAAAINLYIYTIGITLRYMSQITKSSILILGSLLSILLLGTAITVLEPAKGALGETVLGGLTNRGDQIVKGGNHVVSQVS